MKGRREGYVSQNAACVFASLHLMNYIRCMRTTLDIDDDVLSAAKELDASQKTTAGRVISDLVRQALTRSVQADKVQRAIARAPCPRVLRSVRVGTARRTRCARAFAHPTTPF
jgi:hypothetical protein